MRPEAQSPSTTKTEQMLQLWDRMEANAVRRYGAAILQDREHIKARRDFYKQILSSNAQSNNKSLAERAELRILRGQHRSLQRQLYPSPWIRLGRNVLVLTFNMLSLAANAVFTPFKVIAGAFEPRQTYPAVMSASPQPGIYTRENRNGYGNGQLNGYQKGNNQAFGHNHRNGFTQHQYQGKKGQNGQQQSNGKEEPLKRKAYHGPERKQAQAQSHGRGKGRG